MLDRLSPFFVLSRICLYYSVVCINGKPPECQSQATCSQPIPPNNTEISHVATPRNFINGATKAGFGVFVYREHDTVYYYCKEGYSQVHPAPIYVTCGSNGEWFPKRHKINKCIPNRHFDKCKNGLFRCTASRECISASKRCDCVSDCADQSDERNCEVRRKVIMATSSGRHSAGIITSQGYPRLYPDNFTCIYHINTLHTHRIEIKFSEFNLPSKVNKKCVDFVQIIGIHRKSMRGRKGKKFAKRTLRGLVDKKCGKDKFKLVFSNSSHISINFSLGYVPNSIGYRGFSLIWRVRTKFYVDTILSLKGSKDNKIAQGGKPSSREDVYTVLIAVAISALLPLAAILFLCIHRHRVCTGRKTCDEISDTARERTASSDLAASNDSNRTSEKFLRSNIQPRMQLTENNLSQFNNELHAYRDIEQYRCLLHPVEYAKCGRVSSKLCMTSNEITSFPLYPCMDDVTDDGYPLNESEKALYIMSYELSRTPLDGAGENRLTQDPVESLRMSDFNCSSKSVPSFNRTLLHSGRSSRTSSDNATNSYCSQNTGSCRLCSPQKVPEHPYHRKYVNSTKTEKQLPHQHSTRQLEQSEYNRINANYLKPDEAQYFPPERFVYADPRLCNQVCRGARELYDSDVYDDNPEYTDVCVQCGPSPKQFCVENHQKPVKASRVDSSTQCERTKRGSREHRDNVEGKMCRESSINGIDRNMGGSLICTH